MLSVTGRGQALSQSPIMRYTFRQIIKRNLRNTFSQFFLFWSFFDSQNRRVTLPPEFCLKYRAEIWTSRWQNSFEESKVTLDSCCFTNKTLKMYWDLRRGLYPWIRLIKFNTVGYTLWFVKIITSNSWD